jgi:hypothetical protein
MLMKVAVAVAAVVGLGLVAAGCSSGPSATETAACGAILKITLPFAVGGAGLGSNEAISIPTNLVESLIHSGDPTLAHYGRVMAKPGSSNGFVKAFNNAQAQCRIVGA